MAAKSLDDKAIEVAANIAHSVEAKQAFANGAEAYWAFQNR